MDSLFGDIHAFIQIIAGLNLAFAVSNEYNDLLYQKVISSIKKIKKKFLSLENNIVIAKDTILKLPKAKLILEQESSSNDKLKAKSVEIVNTSTLHKDVIKELIVFEKENKESLEKLGDVITNKSRVNFFMLICLYAGLYCISVLLYDAFTFFNYEQIIIFNLMSIILFFVLFLLEIMDKISINDINEFIVFNKVVFKRRIQIVINHKFFLVMFFLFGLFAYISIRVLHHYGLQCPVKIDFWVLFSTVLLSTIHFIWYFILSVYNSQLISRKFSNEIASRKSAFKLFHDTKIKNVISVAEQIRILKTENNSSKED